jgi:hypothetical protein
MKPADPISNKVRDVFEHSVDTLDTATANRLRLMRRDALASNAKITPASFTFKRWWLPMTAAGALCLALSVSLLMQPQVQVNVNVSDAEFSLDDSTLILSEDDADAEMLNWLAHAPVEVASANKGNL